MQRDETVRVETVRVETGPGVPIAAGSDDPASKQGSAEGRDGGDRRVDQIYPEELRRAEQELIRARRAAAGLDRSSQVVGLALSGGGIRSATFCLGVLQALSRHRLLRHVDLMSTVSGGGYIGAFLGRLFTRRWVAQDRPAVEQVEEQLADCRSRPLRWLRDNGRYLAPNGSGDSWLAAAVMLRNLVAVHFALAVGVLGLFVAADLVRLVVARYLHGPAQAWWLGAGEPGHILEWSPWLVLPALLLLGWIAPAAGAFWLTHVERDGSLARRQTTVLAIFTGVAALVAGLHGGPSVAGLIARPGALGLACFWVVASVAIGLWIAVSSELCRPVDRREPAVGSGGDSGRAVLGWSGAWRGRTALAGPRAQALAVALVMLALLLTGATLWWTAGEVGAAAVAVRAGGWAGHGALAQQTRLVELGLAVLGLGLAVVGVDLRLRALELTRHDLRRHRDRLSRCLARGVALMSAALAFVVVDSLGLTVYAALTTDGQEVRDVVVRALVVAAVVLGAALLLSFGRVLPLLDRMVNGGRLKVGWNLVAGLVAVAVVSVLLVSASAVAHWVTWAGQEPVAGGPPAARAVAAVSPDPVGVLAAYSAQVGSGSLLSEEVAGIPPALSSAEQALDARFRVSAAALFLWLLLVVVLARPFCFLALSSHLDLYASRLARTFLGASNEDRWDGAGASMTEAIESDGLAFDEYRPHCFGGPLHLINLTINETVSGESQIEYRDRKGLPMAVGPCGLSAGVRFHGQWSRPDVGSGAGPDPDGSVDTGWIRPLAYDGRRFHALAGPDAMPHRVQTQTLEQWVAASGAALTTGLGWRTSLSLSVLLGLANVRLGLWWDSWISPDQRDGVVPQTLPRQVGELFSRRAPVYSYLLDEILARFHGPLRRFWYLSDGGHFENTGCYELIRRRVPLIICCDCGADPALHFDDLANLVRRVRVDLGADIRFVGASTVRSAGGLGSPASIRAGQGHAAVAVVTYAGSDSQAEARRSLLVLLKPSLSGDEPVDLASYASARSAFPQESTIDQVFDEAQWESYRKLGDHVAESLLAASGDGTWSLAGLIRGEVGADEVCRKILAREKVKT